MPIKDILDGNHTDERVSIRGWVYRKRESKTMIFISLRDASGVIQCTVNRKSQAWTDAKRVTIESSVELSGAVRIDNRAHSGLEISTDKMTIIGLAEVFPITKDQSKEFLLDVRHLWLRSRKMYAIMTIRSEVLKFLHHFFDNNDFAEVSPPMFISSACEGGSTLFETKYFDKSMYLTQSAQLYLEVLIHSLEKVYCVAPSFRAEKSRTIRHLAEYWHVEAEKAFMNLDETMKLEENLLSYICQKVAKECRTELKTLRVNTETLKRIEPPFHRLTYGEAIEKLQKKGFDVEWGGDLGFKEEKTLAEEFGSPFFIYAYPKKIKAFYCKPYKENSELVMSVDLLVPEIGEIATGGSRIDEKEELVLNLKEFGLELEDYDWYIDIRKYGTVPHAGFGLGLERLLAWMLNLGTIMDTIPFPRTVRRFYP